MGKKKSNKKPNIPKISDWDGKSPASAVCKRCGLATHKEMMANEHLCIACSNMNIIYSISLFFTRAFPWAILSAILIFFFLPSFRLVLIPIFAAVLLPAIIAGVFQKAIHFRGIPKDMKVIPILRGYGFNPTFEYYDEALRLWKEQSEESTRELKRNVLNALLTFVIMDDKPTPFNWVQEWSEAFSMTKEQFVEFMRNELPEKFEAILKPNRGFGVIPDLWGAIKDQPEERVKDFLEILNNIASDIDNFEIHQKQMFVEEVYLIEEDIRDIIESNGQYKSLKALLDGFVPEDPPKNRLEAMMRASQAQANKKRTQ